MFVIRKIRVLRIKRRCVPVTLARPVYKTLPRKTPTERGGERIGISCLTSALIQTRACRGGEDAKSLDHRLGIARGGRNSNKNKRKKGGGSRQINNGGRRACEYEPSIRRPSRWAKKKTTPNWVARKVLDWFALGTKLYQWAGSLSE